MRNKNAASTLLLLHVAFASMFSVLEGISPSSSKQVIESFHVQTDIRYRFATTKMCSVIRNTAKVPSEVSFDLTLPKEAFIVSFAMTIDGKVYDGEVKEKAEAKKQYNTAVERGQSAGYIKQTPRHSNRFEVSVNVASNTAVNFTLTYQQILTRKLGVYEYEMYVEPGQAVEDFKLEVYIQENRPLLFVKTPKLRKADLLTNAVEAPNELTTVDRPTPTTAHIQYKPTIIQQGEKGLAARFVVQYDVEHADNGDLLVADGYFIHLFTPKPSSGLPKDIIFVLDVSGSMRGTKIAQVKDAMRSILDDLQEGDRFNIITFSSDVSKWIRVLTEVKPSVIAEAKEFVLSMQADGGTDINQALLSALEELQTREDPSRAGMIFFLTDGEATSGETNPDRIASNVLNKNKDTSIYSLGFGQGANFESLKTISAQNSGFARKIYEASDATLQVETLYEEISCVAMKNVSVSYLPSVTKTTETVFPIVHNGTELIIGGCIDLRWRRPDSSVLEPEPFPQPDIIFEAEMEGIERDGDVDIVLAIDDIDSVTIDPDDSLNPFFTMPRDYAGVVEKMWAFLTIKQMMTEKQKVIEDKDKVEELKKKILEMSLKYSFVTPLTSMVVTKPQSESPVETRLEDAEAAPVRESYYALSSQKSHRRNPYRRMSHHIIQKSSLGGSPIGMAGMGSGRSSHYGSVQNALDPDFSNMQSFPTKYASFKPGRRAQGRKNNKQSTGNRRQKNKNKKRKITKTKKIKMILRSLVFQKNGTRVCTSPKKWKGDKYVLVEVRKEFKVELITGCQKTNCRLVVPEMLVLTNNGMKGTVDLATLDKWVYSDDSNSDFSATYYNSEKMELSHPGVNLVIERTSWRRKIYYSLTVNVLSPSLSSGMIDMMDFMMSRKKRVQRKRQVRGCDKIPADLSYVIATRKALKYLA